MPLYYFSTSLHGAPSRFADGIDLPDDDAAWVEATTACGEILRDLDGALLKAGEWRMEVLDRAHNPLYTLRFTCEAHQDSLAGENRRTD